MNIWLSRLGIFHYCVFNSVKMLYGIFHFLFAGLDKHQPPCNSSCRIQIAPIITQNLQFLAWQNLTSGFPGGSDGKESACSVGDQDLIPGLGRFPGEGNGNPLQYSCLENPMDGGAWLAIAHGVAKIWTWLKWLSTCSLSRQLKMKGKSILYPHKNLLLL